MRLGFNSSTAKRHFRTIAHFDYFLPSLAGRVVPVAADVLTLALSCVESNEPA